MERKGWQRKGREAAVKLGIFSYNTEYGIRPDVLAAALEARGYESLWVGEHSHIPASRESPYPGGEPLPRPYYHMADPFVSLMAAAAATKTLKIGTGICLCAPKARITSGGRFHPDSCRFDLVAGRRFRPGNRRDRSPATKPPPGPPWAVERACGP